MASSNTVEPNDSAGNAAASQSNNASLDYHDPRVTALIDAYWRKNITAMLILLAIWFFVGLGCGVLWADWLNQFSIGGFPLGFWFAQQGAIIAFILLILAYCLIMNRLDRTHHAELERLRQEQQRRAPGEALQSDGNA